MSNHSKFPKIFLWAGSLVIILAIVAAVVIERAHHSTAELPVYGTVPDFAYVNQDGQPFNQSDLEGKVTVLEFFFTSCQGPCPVMNMRMSELYKQYQGTDAVQFVSISVDPARDSLSALKAYSHRYGVTDHRWNFLRGSLQDVENLSVNGFNLGGNFPTGHSTRFVLIDGKGQIRGYYRSLDQASLEVLEDHIRLLARAQT